MRNFVETFGLKVAYFSVRLQKKPTEDSSSSWPQIMKMIQKIFMAQHKFILFQLASTNKNWLQIVILMNF